jgi:hypothetical protein
MGSRTGVRNSTSAEPEWRTFCPAPRPKPRAPLMRRGALLCLFGVTAIVALKYPLVGLGICIACLILYLRPEPPGVGNRISRPANS